LGQVIGMNFGQFDPETEEERGKAISDFRVKQRKNERLHRIWMPIRTVMLIILYMAAVFGLMVGISGIPKKIDVVYPAVEYREEDESYLEHTTITIKGKLYTRWFSDPKFVGRISIDEYDFTKTYEGFDIKFYKDDFWRGRGSLSYLTIIDGNPIIESVGSIWMDGAMDKVNIWVYEPITGDSKSTKDFFISAPAATREEAAAITKQLSVYGTVPIK
jgi:hypothetical protein